MTTIRTIMMLSLIAVAHDQRTVMAFSPREQRTLLRTRRDNICEHKVFRLRKLDMGKGFNSAKNKQAELAKKMALARKQNVGDASQQQGTEGERSQTEEERKLEEDRARFAQLLSESKVLNPNPYESDEIGRTRQPAPMPKIAAKVGALKARKSKTNAKDIKRRKKASVKNEAAKKEGELDEDEPLQEGDVAGRFDFEALVSCKSDAPLGPMNAARLVPWVPPFIAEYMVVLADPRAQSGDLRRTIQYLTSNLSPEILEQVIAINSDEVVETKSWVNRAEIKTPIQLFSDRNWQWMRRYSAVVSDGRWSMSLMVIDNSGNIRKVFRDVDPAKASQLVIDSVESIRT